MGPRPGGRLYSLDHRLPAPAHRARDRPLLRFAGAGDELQGRPHAMDECARESQGGARRSLRYPPISPDPAQGRDAADRPRARGRRLGEDAGRISRRRWAPAQQGGMTMERALLPIRRYSEFSGRSRRKTFWSFHLMLFILSLIASSISSVERRVGKEWIRPYKARW